MKKILYIAPACYPVNGAEAIVNIKLLRTLLQSNEFDVDIVSKKYKVTNYPSASAESYGIESSKLHIVEVDNKVNLKTIWETSLCLFKFGVTMKGAHWAYAALHVVEELVKQTHYDYILTKNAPSYLLGYYLKKKYGLKWVASWNDPYPHDKYPYPYGKGWNYSTMNIQREISRMRKADIHIFPNDRIKSWMQHYLAVPETNIRIVPHVLIPQTAKRPQIQNELRLIHSGSLTAPRNPENLFRALARILSEDPSIKIKLSILGKMDENSLNLINELHLQESIKFLGNVAYDDSIALLSNYDVAVIVEADCKEGIFLPTKVADFMSVNIPILSLSPRTGVLNDLFVAGNIPYFASVDSIDDIAECIHALYQDFKRNDIRQNKIPHEYTSQYVVETYQKL